MKPLLTFSTLTAACAALALASQPALAAATPAPPAEAASQPAAGTLAPDDKAFIERAAQVNLVEIELGNTAAKSSADPAIRKLGKHLAEQHTQAQQKLERLAASKGLILPEKPDAEHQKKIDSLKEQKGDAFNRAFINANIAGHEQALALFEGAAIRTRDGELRIWMAEMIPQLKRHLDAAKGAHPEAVGEKTNPRQESPGSRPILDGPMGH